MRMLQATSSPRFRATHAVDTSFYIALAREDDADILLTTDRDFEALCQDESFEYTNPVPEDVLSEFHAVK